MPQPRKPKTPRGIEARQRRTTDGWAWKYRVRWTDSTGKRRSSDDFDTISEAKDFQAALRLAKRNSILDDLTRGEMTLNEFVEEYWWPKYAAKQLERNTLLTYSSVFDNHLRTRVGHLQLRQITPPVVQALRESMEADKVGAPTVRRAMAILQGICKYAITAGEMKVNPVREVTKPPVTRQLAIVAISPAQVEKLRTVLLSGFTYREKDYRTGRVGEYWHGPDLMSATLVSLLAYEGLRPEEALALMDRHLRDRTLLVEQKAINGEIVTGLKTGRRRSRANRSPELFDPVRRDLREHILALPPDPDRSLLFPRSGGGPWSDQMYRNWRSRVFKPAVREAGLPITRPYDLRHASASLLLHAGWPLTEVADHLGHSVATLSEHYAHLIADLKGKPSVPVVDQILKARGGLERRKETS